MNAQLILTCEHGGHRVPAAYRSLFRGADQILTSHRGWDPGSLAMGKTFQRMLGAPLFLNTVTRLLVEPNRSIGHRQLFSEFTTNVDPIDRETILAKYYYAHRDRIEEWIASQVRSSQCVVHLSMHTFTSKLNGQTRKADVGLLYDPGRKLEWRLCSRWRSAIKQLRDDVLVRRNYPYLGKADGFTTYLRRHFPADRYLGIELEVNQRWPAGNEAEWRRLRKDLATTLSASLQGWR
jgi:predicted N-formylglutamate amidohydrolase